MELNSSLLTAKVWHKRFFPRTHEFIYNVYYVVLRVADPTHAENALFSIDRWNIWNKKTSDHGARDGSSWEVWIRNILHEHALDGVCDGPIELMTHPRLLGYAFNPISFWFCLDSEHRLRAVLCEVRNTFGDRQNYLVSHADARPIMPSDKIEGTKAMHVSPFNIVEGKYHFSFAHSAERIRANVDYIVGGERMIATAVSGTRAPLSPGALAFAFFRYPLMTLKVIAGIHFEAARLWVLKKMPYRTYKPHENPSLKTMRDPVGPESGGDV